MELSALSENVIAVPYKRGSHELELQVNIDALTPEFFRLQKERAAEKLKEILSEIANLNLKSAEHKPKKKLTKAQKAEERFKLQAESAINAMEYQVKQKEAERESYAELLSSNVLKDWDVVDNGVPVKPTKEVLMALPPNGLEELWRTCVSAAKTVKKRVDEEDEETLGDTAHGSKVVNLADRHT